MRRYFSSALLAVSLCAIAFGSCGQVKKAANPDSAKSDWDETIAGNFSEQSKVLFDSSQVVSFLKSYPEFKKQEVNLRSFYRRRSYSYAWYDKGALIEQAGNLSSRVMNLEKDGVYKPLPYLTQLDSMLYSSANQKLPDAMLELMLTSQYFAFSKVAWQGTNASSSTQAKWFLPRKKVSYDLYLDSLLKTPVQKTAAVEPVYRQYELLREYLRKYRVLDAKNNWLPFQAVTEKFQPGDSSAVIADIKDRLCKLEDFNGNIADRFYNAELIGALKAFQKRHGLTVDGNFNKETRNELNLPLKARIRQILVNMERSRWLPVAVNTDYLAVNIPEFKLHVYRADSLLWSCNVVVGQTVHPTTVFYGEVKYVVFSPYWNVPSGILRNEVLPGMRKNRNYLANHNMEIAGYTNGTPNVRQKPGSTNALGLVKFLFPNSYNIYLHDTPSKSLFGESTRAFSHGCIRVAEPAKLASFLLGNTPEWTESKIATAMRAGKEKYVTLEKKVPVFIAYFTAFIDRDGRMNFRKDLYNLDDRLASMILAGDGKY